MLTHVILASGVRSCGVGSRSAATDPLPSGAMSDVELGHFYSFFNWLPTTSSVFFWVTDHELDHFSSQMPPQITPNRKVTPHNTRPPDLHLPSLIVLFYQGI